MSSSIHTLSSSNSNPKQQRALILGICVAVLVILLVFASGGFSSSNNSEKTSSRPQSSSSEAIPFNINRLPYYAEEHSKPTPFPRSEAHMQSIKQFVPPPIPDDNLRIGVCAIARKEYNYIADWVKYTLALGFDRIYLYDNEETPTYADLLRKEGLSCCVTELGFNERLPTLKRLSKEQPCRVVVKRFLGTEPHNHSIILGSLDDCYHNHLLVDGFTHGIHFDIDEWIQLNKHNNIREFVKHTLTDEHGIDPTCGSVNLEWVFYGSSGLTDYTPVPLPLRFVCRRSRAERHGKPFFRVDAVRGIHIHYVHLHGQPGTRASGEDYPRPEWSEGLRERASRKWRRCSDRNDSMPWYGTIHTDISEIAQLNHYRAKTPPEYIFTRSRRSINLLNDFSRTKRKEMSKMITELQAEDFNQVLDDRARMYYLRNVEGLSEAAAKAYPYPDGFKCPFDNRARIASLRNAIAPAPPGETEANKK